MCDREKRDHRSTEEASASFAVRFPEISTQTFDCKILSWKSLWEPFNATNNSKPGLNDVEKLTYLQDDPKIVLLD